MNQFQPDHVDNGDNLLDCFRNIVGAGHVLDQASDTEAYLTDWTGQYSGKTLAVLRPSTTEQVSRIVEICNANEISIVPQGGATGLCGGGVPIEGQPSVILSLTRMNKIRRFDEAGRTVVVESGVVLETLHSEALQHGLIFPLMFGAKGSCTIGGNLSTNAGGSNVVRYGNTRDLCVGIEAVMPDGKIINALTGLHKDNTGYDLKNLLIGAEGTLGIITAAVLKLFKEPSTRVTAFLAVASLEKATEVLNRIQDISGAATEAFEYMPQRAIDVIRSQFPQVRAPLDGTIETGILLEAASSRPTDAEELPGGTTRLVGEIMSELEALMESELVLDAVIAQSEQQRADLWFMRESILEAITKNGPAYHMDISLPLSNVANFVEQMDPFAAELGFAPIIIGHLGDGNLHYALATVDRQELPELQLERAKTKAFSLLRELNGSFSAEHGIGQSKLNVMAKLKEPSQITVMRAIKTTLDPNNIMNPGKLVPDV